MSIHRLTQAADTVPFSERLSQGKDYIKKRLQPARDFSVFYFNTTKTFVTATAPHAVAYKTHQLWETTHNAWTSIVEKGSSCINSVKTFTTITVPETNRNLVSQTLTSLERKVKSTKAATATHMTHLKEKSQHTWETHPRLSQVVNTAYQTGKAALPLAGTYLLRNALITPESFLLSSLAWGGAFLTTGYLLHTTYNTRDCRSQVNDIISELDLLTHREHLPIGEKGETSPFMTFHKAIQLIDDLLYHKTRELFNLHSLTGNDRASLENLKRLLQAHIPEDPHHSLDLLPVSEEIQQATQEALSTLTELKARCSGYASAAYQTPDLHPRLQELTEELKAFQKSLFTHEDVEEHIDNLNHLLTICIRTPSILKKITGNSTQAPLLITPPSPEELASLTQLQESLGYFDSFSNQQFSCEDNPVLNPLREELTNAHLNPVLQLCYDRLLLSDPSKATHFLLKAAPTELSLLAQASASHISEQKASALERLLSILEDLGHTDQRLIENHQEETRATILQYLKAIDLEISFPSHSFEALFLDYVGKDSGDPSPKTWAKGHLFDPGINLKDAFLEALRVIAIAKNPQQGGLERERDLKLLLNKN
jgi:uncharacterized protein YukE